MAITAIAPITIPAIAPPGKAELPDDEVAAALSVLAAPAPPDVDDDAVLALETLVLPEVVAEDAVVDVLTRSLVEKGVGSTV